MCKTKSSISKGIHSFAHTDVGQSLVRFWTNQEDKLRKRLIYNAQVFGQSSFLLRDFVLVFATHKTFLSTSRWWQSWNCKLVTLKKLLKKVTEKLDIKKLKNTSIQKVLKENSESILLSVNTTFWNTCVSMAIIPFSVQALCPMAKFTFLAPNKKIEASRHMGTNIFILYCKLQHMNYIIYSKEQKTSYTRGK